MNPLWLLPFGIIGSFLAAFCIVIVCQGAYYLMCRVYGKKTANVATGIVGMLVALCAVLLATHPQKKH